MKTVRIGLLGASGRMGRALSSLIDDEYRDRCELAARPTSKLASFDELADTDVVVDFSLAAGTEALTDWLRERSQSGPAVVCGTTGLSGDQLAELRALGETRRVLYASNFSAGVSALEALLRFAGPLLDSLGYTPVVTEAHHAGKRDAPSGTAKSLQAVLSPDDPTAVQTHSLRGGSVIGEHEIRFLGADDEIVVAHKAQTRRLFARGALEAALWIVEHANQPGFMTMRDYFCARYELTD